MSYLVRFSATGVELEITAGHLTELDKSLRQLKDQGVYEALKGAARDFSDAPVARAESEAVQALAEVGLIADTQLQTPQNADPQPDLPAEKQALDHWNDLAAERSADEVAAAEAKQPKCAVCGENAYLQKGKVICTAAPKGHPKPVAKPLAV